MGQQDDAVAAATEVEELRQRVAELEGRSSRRTMLRLAGAAVVGGVAATVAGAQPAAATTGALQFGLDNDAGTAGTSLASMSTNATFYASNFQGGGSSEAISGVVTGNGTAVHGKVNSPSNNGYGVWGEANGSVGYGVVAQGGAAQVSIEPFLVSGVPASGLHRKGELVANTTGLYYCLSGAQTGVGTWQVLADQAAAGAFFPISPARVYDSRKPAPLQGILATGANRLVSVADKRDTNTGAVTGANVVPVGATAIAFNLTVVNTVGTNGFLAVNEGGNTTVAASLINWSSASLTTANSTVVKINSSRQVTVICGGTSTSCHFIIDVLGYYR